MTVTFPKKIKGLEINKGTLYPLLRRLEAQGLLNSDWLVVDDVRPRRHYKSNAEGERILTSLTNEWLELVAVLGCLLGNQKNLLH